MFNSFISFLLSKIPLWNNNKPEVSDSTDNAIVNDDKQNKEFINFLKSNTENTNINNDIFRVQNLLNDVYALIEQDIQKRDIEFIYDVSPTVAIELVSDNLRIQKILYNLISYVIDVSNCENIIVSLDSLTIEKSMHFEIKCNDDTKKEIQKNISHNTEGKLTIVKNIISEMNGHFNSNDQSFVYDLTLPILENELYAETHYTLPESIENKKVLLCEKNETSANILKNIFEHFGLNVEIHASNNLSEVKNLTDYDMIVFDTTQLIDIYLRHLGDIKSKSTLKIISLSNIPSKKRRLHKPNSIVDTYLYKPLSYDTVYTTLYDIYIKQTPHREKSPLKENDEIHFIQETKNITPENFQDFNGTHILLIEDGIINQKIIQSILAKSTIQLQIANNGLEALEYLDKNPNVDLILTDINMPIMDGYEATEKIREKDTFSSTPIVVVSTLNFRDQIEKMYTVGANAHLTKPFKIGELYTAFNMYIQNLIHEEKQIKYVDDISILDTEKGIRNIKNIIRYEDALRESLVMQKQSNEYIKELIIKKEFDTLYNYCKNKKSDNISIGAIGLSNILNEIMILAENREEAILQTYISSYYNEWRKARQYIDYYLNFRI